MAVPGAWKALAASNDLRQAEGGLMSRKASQETSAIVRQEDGTPNVQAVESRSDRERLYDAAHRLEILKQEEAECKSTIESIMRSAGFAKVQCGPVRAYCSPGESEQLSGEDLLKAKVRPMHIARAAWGVSKAKLLEQGVAADVVQKCVRKTKYTKVYVRRTANGEEG
jgi:hypothetical protein